MPRPKSDVRSHFEISSSDRPGPKSDVRRCFEARSSALTRQTPLPVIRVFAFIVLRQIASIAHCKIACFVPVCEFCAIGIERGRFPEGAAHGARSVGRAEDETLKGLRTSDFGPRAAPSERASGAERASEAERASKRTRLRSKNHFGAELSNKAFGLPSLLVKVLNLEVWRLESKNVVVI